MCGLVGAYGVPIDPSGSLALIAHRGPDGSGWAVCGAAQLGHTRLAIQDVSGAASQPFRSGPVTLTYNGEAYNAPQLRAALPGPWTTSGDTELVAALLEAHGADGLDHIEGMFAVAWHDTRSGTWLARDRYGKIPLQLRGVLRPADLSTLSGWIHDAGWTHPEVIFKWHNWVLLGATTR